MKKRILLACFIVTAVPAVTFAAATRPVVTISLGSDRTNVYSTKTITLIPPFQNAYLGSNHYDSEMVGGVFLGAETTLQQSWAIQYGLSYFQTSSLGERGNVYQFADPAFNNLRYQYQIQSRRVAFETKFSHAIKTMWHPYIAAGLGRAINKSYAYIETPLSSDALPMGEPFANHTTHSFTYSAGLGVDMDVDQHLRVGIGYRFLDLGNASLGTTSIQSSSNTISNTHLHTNEWLGQITYVG